MLSEGVYTEETDTNSVNYRMYKRILTRFNTSLFGRVPATSNDFVVDDGDYDSEIEQFGRDVRAESPIESDDSEVEVINASPRLASPPALPLRLDQRVSISVASHVSHTVAASSQVSNIINSSVTLPTERDTMETSPPTQVTSRPLPKKKKGTAASTTTSEEPEPTAAATKNKRSTRGAKPAPAPPTRVLRDRA